MTKDDKIATNNVSGRAFKEFWKYELLLFKSLGKLLSGAFSDDQYEYHFVEKLIFCLGFSVLSTFLCFSMYTIYAVECDITFAAEFVPLVLSIFTITVKGTVMWLRKVDLFTIIAQFNTLWIYARTKLNLMREIEKLLTISKKVRYVYMITILFLGTCYGTRPYILILKNYLEATPESNSTIDFSINVYPLAFPFTCQTINRYILLLLYESCIDYFCVTYLVCDVLYVHLMTHLAINFSVLADDFSLVHQHVDHQDYTITPIVELAKKHLYLLSLARKIEWIFSPVFLATIILNGIDLCLCVLVLDKEISNGNWALVARSSMHALILFVQILTYCDFSHTATGMINSVQMSLYNSEWIDSTLNYKKVLIIMMMHASKEYQFTAYNIVILNREQMTKATMSYFTMLRNFA